MAFTYGFYNSMNGDRKYNAEHVSSLFDGVINEGVFHSYGAIFGVTPGAGMQVLVDTGKAWLKQTWSINDAIMPLPIAPADITLSRYDAVVLEVNSGEGVRANRIFIKTGTAATTPQKPAMTNNADIAQRPIAYILVPGNAQEITGSMIQMVVGTTEFPFVTGILSTVDISVLFGQWSGVFNNWFSNVQAQLTGDVVTNLQGQISELQLLLDYAEGESALLNELAMPVSQQEAVAGILEEIRAWSPERIAQAVRGVPMTGFAAAAGTVAATDSLIQALNKLSYVATQAEAEAGTVTVPRAWTPQRVSQAIKKISSPVLLYESTLSADANSVAINTTSFAIKANYAELELLITNENTATYTNASALNGFIVRLNNLSTNIYMVLPYAANNGVNASLSNFLIEGANVNHHQNTTGTYNKLHFTLMPVQGKKFPIIGESIGFAAQYVDLTAAAYIGIRSQGIALLPATADLTSINLTYTVVTAPNPPIFKKGTLIKLYGYKR